MTSKLAAMFITGFAIAFLIFYSPESPRIGNNNVPNITCEEDSVITFVDDGNPPFDLGCVHVDELRVEDHHANDKESA